MKKPLSPGKQAFLLDDISEQYENPTGADHKSKDFENQEPIMGSGSSTKTRRAYC